MEILSKVSYLVTKRKSLRDNNKKYLNEQNFFCTNNIVTILNSTCSSSITNRPPN